MQKTSFYLSAALTLGGFICLIIWPADASRAACEGLQLCAGTLIPALFPFFCLSSMASATGLTAFIGRRASRRLYRLGLPGEVYVPFTMGICGGYPIGAKTLADMVRNGECDPVTASRILPMCNNTGPAFMIGVAGIGIFGSSKIGIILYVTHMLAALIVGLIMCRGSSRGASYHPAPQPLARAFTESVTSSAQTSLNISAFVVFFSVIRGIFEASGLFDMIIAVLGRFFGLSAHFSSAIIMGVMELGSGIGAMQGLAAEPRNIALCAFVLGFGSLSVHCQTLAAVANSNIKCARHFAGRILCGIFAAVLSYFAAALL